MSPIWALVVMLTVMVAETSAQSNSPYSIFGLGDIQNPAYGRSKGMGGVGIGLRLPNMLNVMNPASYSAVGNQSFIFDAGIEYQHTNYVTDNLAQVGQTANLSHLAFAFPFIDGRWYTSVGLSPYSTVGYDISTYEYEKGVGDKTNTYEGAGGVNRLHWGHSVRLHKGLSVGVNAYYLFGTIDNVRTSQIKDEKTDSRVKWEQNSVVRDFAFDYGIQYQRAINDELIVTVGAVVTQPVDVKVTNETLATNSWYVNGRAAVNPDTGAQLIDTLLFTEGEEGKIEMPLQYGVGASVVIKQKLILSADYHVSKWSETNAETMKGSITDATKINVGAEFVPNYRSLKYWDRVRYRLGAKMHDTYWKFGDDQIQDKSLTLGIGLPMKRSASMFDIALEVGQRGTLSNGLVQENYIKASINFTLQDFWFIKRKFD